MNEFMVVVERAVRPVQAGPNRKLRMREELLAHLTSIHEEELARLGDETAARAEALRRFGDPVALTAELQHSLRWQDRIDARLNRTFGWRPGESGVGYSARLAVLTALVILPFLPFLLVASRIERAGEVQWLTAAALVRFFAGVWVAVPLGVFVLSVLTIRMRDAMHGALGARRSWRRVAAFAGLALVALPGLGLLFAWVGLGHVELLADVLRTTPLAVVASGFLFVPLYLVWFAWKLGPAQIQHVEWATLDIGG